MARDMDTRKIRSWLLYPMKTTLTIKFRLAESRRTGNAKSDITSVLDRASSQDKRRTPTGDRTVAIDKGRIRRLERIKRSICIMAVREW
jgi:hypothetical protein